MLGAAPAKKTAGCCVR